MGIGSAPEGKYRHWDTLRHVAPPPGLTSEEWWAAIKFARSQAQRRIPLKDRNGRSFVYSTPDPVLGFLHEIDRDASGRIALPEAITNPHTKDRYVQSSLIEEAITSSQLEGAAATREQARDMLRSGRKPIDRSERMILNNYHAMQLISAFKNKPLTPDVIFEIHRTITRETLSDDVEPPYLRQPNDGIAVFDDRDNVLLHHPPKASEIPARMQAMCDFANGTETEILLHPVLKAIILHFWLAYDHPFVDGNGRTARALFYWCMLSEGYWLAEFISISSILRKAPARYGRSFLYTETDDNDLTYFLAAQLQVIRRAIQELHKYLAKKVEEIRKTEQLLRISVDLNHRQLALLSHALRHPGTRYTIESHKMSHGVTYQTARTDLLDLESQGLLLKGRSGKAFTFMPVVDLYERLQQLA
jgi:Fic family protein